MVNYSIYFKNNWNRLVMKVTQTDFLYLQSMHKRHLAKARLKVIIREVGKNDWPNDWAVLWVLICTVHLTAYSYYVTYAFQSESALYSCLKVKKLLARSRRKIWSLSDCNWTRTKNDLTRKRTLNHLAKLRKDLKNSMSKFRRPHKLADKLCCYS